MDSALFLLPTSNYVASMSKSVWFLSSICHHILLICSIFATFYQQYCICQVRYQIYKFFCWKFVADTLQNLFLANLAVFVFSSRSWLNVFDGISLFFPIETTILRIGLTQCCLRFIILGIDFWAFLFDVSIKKKESNRHAYYAYQYASSQCSELQILDSTLAHCGNHSQQYLQRNSTERIDIGRTAYFRVTRLTNKISSESI